MGERETPERPTHRGGRHAHVSSMFFGCANRGLRMEALRRRRRLHRTAPEREAERASACSREAAIGAMLLRSTR